MRNTYLITAAIAVVAGGIALALSQSDQVKTLMHSSTTVEDTQAPPNVASVSTPAQTAAQDTTVAATTTTDTTTPAMTPMSDATVASNTSTMTPQEMNTQTPAAGDESQAKADEANSKLSAKPHLAKDVKIDVKAALEDRSIGSKDAKVTVYDYSSLTCPHCSFFHNEILPKIKENYIDNGKVRWVFKGFPLNEPALKAEMVARCAPKDQYVKLIDMMYAEQSKWAFQDDPMATLSIMVRIAGISEDLFLSCINNSELETEMVKRSEEATKKYEINSTPTFVINDGEKTITGAGSYTGFAYDLDEVLKKDPKEKMSRPTSENKADFMPPADDASKAAEDTLTNKK